MNESTEGKLKSIASAVFKWVNAKAVQLLGGLIMEKKIKTENGDPTWVVSLGRVAFWIVFLHAMYLFNSEGRSISPEELNILYGLLGYQGVKVGKDIVAEVRGK